MVQSGPGQAYAAGPGPIDGIDSHSPGWAPGWMGRGASCWNALKFIIMGPVSVALLIRARLREAAVHRHQRHDSRGEASLREPALRV